MIHLHPVTDLIEWQSKSPGIYMSGKFFNLPIGAVKLLEILYENQGKFVSIYKLVRHTNLTKMSVPVYINRIRNIVNIIGYSIRANNEQGYKIELMKAKQ